MKLKKMEKQNFVKSALKFKIQTANEFFEGFTKNSRNIPKIMGECLQVWLYIHGPSHYEALKGKQRSRYSFTRR